MPPRPSIPPDDLYARLEVPSDASFEAIEIAWRALLKRHHPDVAGHAGLEAAKRINVAHDWLSDPALRARYDLERRRARRPPAGPWRAGAPERPPRATATVRPSPPDAASALRRFLERLGRLTRDELDRLSVAETTSIAFVASIDRFLTDDQVAAIERVEREVRSRLPRAAWANAPVRDAVLAAAHELVLAPFLDEHLTEPFRSRARDRLMRGWEAAVGQPRYGPNTTAVERFVARAGSLTAAEARLLAGAFPRDRADLAWPRGLDPEEDDGLRVSTVLAGRDAVEAASEGLAALDDPARERAARVLVRTAHALVLRHGFDRAELDRLLGPWRAATGTDGAADPTDTHAEPRVQRR